MVPGSSMRWSWPRRVWPHLRAIVLLVHVSGMVLMALPSSHLLGDRAHWETPAQQREIGNWADIFGVDKERFQSFLWRVSQHYLAIRKDLVKPFYVYADYTGARQAWTMFATPRSVSARLEISLEIDGEWRLVYEPHHGDHDWNQWQFEHNRIRKMSGRIASSPRDGVYKEFTNWLARRLAEDFPQVRRAKISLIRWPLQPPQDVRAGRARKEQLVQNQEYELEELR